MDEGSDDLCSGAEGGGETKASAAFAAWASRALLAPQPAQRSESTPFEASRAAHLKVGEGELDNEADGALALHKDVAQLNHILVAQLVEKLDLPQRSAVYPCRQSRAGVSV